MESRRRKRKLWKGHESSVKRCKDGVDSYSTMLDLIVVLILALSSNGLYDHLFPAEQVPIQVGRCSRSISNSEKPFRELLLYKGVPRCVLRYTHSVLMSLCIKVYQKSKTQDERRLLNKRSCIWLHFLVNRIVRPKPMKSEDKFHDKTCWLIELVSWSSKLLILDTQNVFPFNCTP